DRRFSRREPPQAQCREWRGVRGDLALGLDRCDREILRPRCGSGRGSSESRGDDDRIRPASAALRAHGVRGAMMSAEPAKLYFMCGKMAAGKSTMAKDLAVRQNAVLVVQDEFLAALYPDEILDIPDFVRCSSRLRNAIAPHVCALLSRGISVVLDFPGNTMSQRIWFRTL